jgi:hypothetical protein
MNNNIERIDFWKREITPKKIIEKDLEQAFEAGRKKFMDKLYTYDTFYDYKKSLVKK